MTSRPLALLRVRIADQKNRHDDGEDHGLDDDGHDENNTAGSSGAAAAYAPSSLCVPNSLYTYGRDVGSHVDLWISDMDEGV